MKDHENDSQGRKPDFVAYNVQETQDGKGIWNKVGAAWKHKDGQGMEINLNSFPIDGRITLRELREERMQDYSEERKTQQRTREPGQRHRNLRSR